MSDDWGWVNNLKLQEIKSKEFRNQLTYLAIIVTTIRMSMAKAYQLQNRVEIVTVKKKQEEIEKQLAALMRGDDPGVQLMHALMTAAIGLTAGILVGAVIEGAFSLATVRVRHLAWNRDFGSKTFADVLNDVRFEIGENRIKSWEDSLKPAYQKIQKIKKNVSPTIKSMAEPVTQKGIELLIHADSKLDPGVLHPREDDKLPAMGNAEGSADPIGPIEFWDHLKNPLDEMEQLITHCAVEVLSLEEHQVPLLPEDMWEDMRKQLSAAKRNVKQLLPSVGQSVTKEFEKILERDERRSIKVSMWNDLALKRLAYVWLFEYVALYDPPWPPVNDSYFNQGDRETVPFRSPGTVPGTQNSGVTTMRHEVPYKVDGQWFTKKLEWSKYSAEKSRAKTLVEHLKRDPEFAEKYDEIARKHVTVVPDREEFTQVSAAFGVLNDKTLFVRDYWDSPSAEDARLDYAYTLLAQDVHSFRAEQIVRSLKEYLAGDQNFLDRMWDTYQNASLFRNECIPPPWR